MIWALEKATGKSLRAWRLTANVKEIDEWTIEEQLEPLDLTLEDG